MTVPLGGMHTISFDAVQAFTSLARLLNHDITEDVVTQCLRLLPDPYDVFSYVAQATKRNVRNSKPNGSWSAKDFGWEDIGEKPKFASHRPTLNESRGTLSFINHQLIVPSGYIVYEAIHDLESFWWILIYICLTAKRGCKRKDYYPFITKELRDLVNIFSETNEKIIAYDKSAYFDAKTNRPYEKLLGNFHTHFDPLKPMLRRWRDALILGYTFKAYEYYRIHDFVIEIIRDALRDLRRDLSNVG